MNLSTMRKKMLPSVLSIIIAASNPIMHATRLGVGLSIMPQRAEAVIPFVVIASIPVTESLLAALGLGTVTLCYGKNN